ncbi:MAG TPA: RDD family protein, partial [Candidatus Ozemobacteraceae bacterium]|nr:RDD family protein [Candidatus Ozemobacteraceae bacterium]
GGRIGWAASVSRNLLRVVDFLPMFFVTGMISILFSTRHQRLGDLAAGTIVIRDAESLPTSINPEMPGSPVPPVDA